MFFEDFLKSEFSEENIQFWKACERYKTVSDEHLQKEAEVIFDEFISQHAPKLVSLPAGTAVCSTPASVKKYNKGQNPVRKSVIYGQSLVQ